MLDIADVQEEYSAGHFFQSAREATRDILQARRTPVAKLVTVWGANECLAELVDQGAEGQDTYRGGGHRLLLTLVHLWQAPHPGVHSGRRSCGETDSRCGNAPRRTVKPLLYWSVHHRLLICRIMRSHRAGQVGCSAGCG